MFMYLLVLDKVYCHPANLTAHHPNGKVVIIPRNTRSLVQPMDKMVTTNKKH
jgi:hypothetical protein